LGYLCSLTPTLLFSMPVKIDSLLLAPEQSLFSSHELPVKHHSIVLEKEKGSDALLAAIFLIAFTLFVGVKVYSPRKLNQVFLAFVKPVALNQLLREEHAFTNRTSILLLLLSSLILPLFAFQAAGYSSTSSFLFQYTHSKGLGAYLLFILFVAGAYLLKVLVVRFMAFTLSAKVAGSEYVYTILLFNKVAGLILFPLVLLIAFARQINSHVPLYAGFAILTILLIYRTLRLIQIGLSTSGVSVLYLFLYLCTLEILPFVVLIKLFMFSFS
jgi:hypothetical protein